MLLTIRTTHRPATDLGFSAPQAPGARTHTGVPVRQRGRSSTQKRLRTAARRRYCSTSTRSEWSGAAGAKGGAEDQYVNDRPYVASSLLSVVLSRWFKLRAGRPMRAGNPSWQPPSCHSRQRLAACALPRRRSVFSGRCSSLSATRFEATPSRTRREHGRPSVRADCSPLRSARHAG